MQITTETGHPLADTIARFAWLLPVLPLLGFLLNGWLSLKHAAKLGPSDPSAQGHDNDSHHREHREHGEGTPHGAAEAHDDHAHHPARHPSAKLVSLIGPGVLA